MYVEDAGGPWVTSRSISSNPICVVSIIEEYAYTKSWEHVAIATHTIDALNYNNVMSYTDLKIIIIWNIIVHRNTILFRNYIMSIDGIIVSRRKPLGDTASHACPIIVGRLCESRVVFFEIMHCLNRTGLYNCRNGPKWDQNAPITDRREHVTLQLSRYKCFLATEWMQVFREICSF